MVGKVVSDSLSERKAADKHDETTQSFQFCEREKIVSNGDFEEFLGSVKSKFSLGIDTEIILEDDEGTEIDEDAFPILLEQGHTPNITFNVRGEISTELSIDPSSLLPNSPQIIYVSNQLPSSSAPSTCTGSFRVGSEELDYYKQILESHVEENPKLQELINNCKANSFVDSNAAAYFVTVCLHIGATEGGINLIAHSIPKETLTGN